MKKLLIVLLSLFTISCSMDDNKTPEQKIKEIKDTKMELGIKQCIKEYNTTQVTKTTVITNSPPPPPGIGPDLCGCIQNVINETK